jgi:serine/threonine-protein kinase
MHSDLIGRELDRYKIVEKIGAGGMATVYKAYDTRLERDVAVKVIRRDAFHPDEIGVLLKRFEREAKSLGRLSHPNIVGVIDFGEFEGAPYLVMEYLPGGTLRDRLGKPYPWREAVQMILPIAQALDYVHNRNIINRDVKPSNVLMTENGQPLLTDFGLLKVFGDKNKDTTSLTATGIGLGTPDYMAPEQWRGEATAKSDLYSLGVILYEMITGYRPYTADTPAGVLLAQANEPLPLPTKYVPDLPKDIESILLKTLAKEPANRYENVHAFITELENLLAGRVVSASTINTEKLRKQMTGTTRPSYQPAKVSNKWIPLISLLIGFGIISAFGISGYLIFANPGFISPQPVPSFTQFPAVTDTPTSTAVPPTATLESTPTLEATFLPTATALSPEIRDSRNIPMVLVPAGEFTMGSDDTGNPSSKPAHTVYLDAYYIDKFEVSNENYDACAYAVECRKPINTGSVTRRRYFNNPVFTNYPVIYVEWKMAQQYCQWRGGRLPTEAEWEKAARGTDARVYPWMANELNCSYANYYGCIGDTSPVDQYDVGVSAYGAYGMAGNVWEWTSSLFGLYPYDAADGREDQKARGKRIVRGGSWYNFGGIASVRVDIRFDIEPGYAGAYVGFRCVHPVEMEMESPQ